MQHQTNRKHILPLLRYRTPLYHPDIPFGVCWSQKSGCTAILKWFLFQADLLEEALQYQFRNAKLQIHNYENQVFKARPGYQQELADHIAAGKPMVNFMRCPFERAFSCYMHLQNKEFVKLDASGADNPGLALRREILQSIYGGPVSIEYTYSFLDYLRWLQQQDMQSVNAHHRPQYSALYENATVQHIRLESFSTATKALEIQFGLKESATAGDLFTSSHHKAKSPVDNAIALKLMERGIPLRVTSAFQLPKVTREVLADTEMGDIIETLFSKDIEIYDAIEEI